MRINTRSKEWSVQIDQTQDLPFTKILTHFAEIGYLFSRSSESYLNNTYGQDYLNLRNKGRKLCFALCDGVGQSFCGQIAAKSLGDQIVDWIWNLPVGFHEDKVLQDNVNDYLNLAAVTAHEVVRTFLLPENLPDLVRRALENLREYGSETVFLSGRIDFAPFNTLTPDLLTIFWLGDVQIHLYNHQGTVYQVTEKWVNSERWSTKFGIKGTDRVNIFIGELNNIERVIVHSDGISSLREQLYTLSKRPETLRMGVEQLRNSPTSDDISLLTIRLRMRKRMA